MPTIAHRPVILFASLASVVAACSSEAPPAQAPPPPAVTVQTLQTESVTLTRELPGRTRPSLVAEVRPQVTGIVARRLFEEGAEVEAGQPLYQLDDATYQADVNTAKAQLHRAEATLKSARLTAARAASLAKINAVSDQEHEDATAALAEAEADVGAARAALDAARVTLGYAHITAPISGRVGRSSVTQGALVTANQAEPLATLQQLDPMYIDVTQSSKELLELRQHISAGRVQPVDDLPVTILLEDGTPYEHQGKLAFSEVTVDPSTGSFVLRVVVDNPDRMLLPGMYVRALVGNAVRPDAILVPQQAVARDPKGQATVMVVNGESKIEQRPIEVSRTVGDRWLVENGLAAGDRVVVEGLQKASPGATVTVDEPAGKQPPSATTSARN
jgi:membrane fusion protein (multidrug efflux system)